MHLSFVWQNRPKFHNKFKKSFTPVGSCKCVWAGANEHILGEAKILCFCQITDDVFWKLNFTSSLCTQGSVFILPTRDKVITNVTMEDFGYLQFAEMLHS